MLVLGPITPHYRVPCGFKLSRGRKKPLHPSVGYEGMEGSSRRARDNPKYSRRLSPLFNRVRRYGYLTRFESVRARVYYESLRGVNGTSRELFEDTVMERFVIIWAKLRGGPAEWARVWLAYGWPRLKRFEINVVLNIMVQVWCRLQVLFDVVEYGESVIY